MREQKKEVLFGARVCGYARGIAFSVYPNKKAFTLTEMLISLLVTVIIIGALAPVITKRYQESLKASVDSSFTNSAFLTYDSTDGRKYTKGNAKQSLTQISPGVIEFTNKEGTEITLTLSIQGAGGGGSGAQAQNDLTTDSTLSTTANQPYTSTADKTWIWQPPKGTANIRLTLQGGGGSGGIARYFSMSATSEDYLLSSAGNGNEGDLVIKKYNIGDIPSLLPSGANMAGTRDLSSYPAAQRGGIPEGVNLVASVASGATAGSASNTCWYAKTLPTAYTCTNATGYSGCYRTLCTQDVAINACEALSPFGAWRLPDDAEIQRWRAAEGSNSVYQAKGVVTSNASDFCDYSSSGYGAAQCYLLANGCQGANNGHCYPNTFWSSVSQGGYNLSGGTLNGPNSTVTTYALSARCVRYTFIPYHGAGGSSGAQILNLPLTDFKEGDRIVFTIGKGGAVLFSGGLTRAILQRYTTSWSDVATYIANGGPKGGDAGASAHGVKGAAPTCSPAVNCTNGSQGLDWPTDASTQGAASSYGLGGATATPTSYAGKNAANFGAAGSGGYTNSNTELGSGGQGGAGYAKITYDIRQTGSGGGAGGYIKNIKIKVPPNSKVTFNIGQGGIKGTLSSPDSSTDGGDTTITQNSQIIYQAQGGKKATITQGGEGGRIYQRINSVLTDISDTTTLDEQKGENPKTFQGGNGGLSKSSSVQPQGGCSSTNNPQTFSDCIYNYTPDDAPDPKYETKTNRAQGGSGGGGAGCDATTCSDGGTGSNGFVILSW